MISRALVISMGFILVDLAANLNAQSPSFTPASNYPPAVPCPITSISVQQPVTGTLTKVVGAMPPLTTYTYTATTIFTSSCGSGGVPGCNYCIFTRLYEAIPGGNPPTQLSSSDTDSVTAGGCNTNNNPTQVTTTCTNLSFNTTYTLELDAGLPGLNGCVYNPLGNYVTTSVTFTTPGM